MKGFHKCLLMTLCNLEIVTSHWSHMVLLSPVPHVGDRNLYGKISKAGQDDLAARVHFQLKTCTTYSTKEPSRLQWAPSELMLKTLRPQTLPSHLLCLSPTYPDISSAKQYSPIGFLVQFSLPLPVSWYVYSASN